MSDKRQHPDMDAWPPTRPGPNEPWGPVEWARYYRARCVGLERAEADIRALLDYVRELEAAIFDASLAWDDGLADARIAAARERAEYRPPAGIAPASRGEVDESS